MTIIEIIRQTILNNPSRKDLWWDTVRAATIIDRDIYSASFSLNLVIENKDMSLIDILTYLYQDHQLKLRVIDFDKAKDFITIYGSRHLGNTKYFIFVQAWKTEENLGIQVLSDTIEFISIGKDKISK